MYNDRMSFAQKRLSFFPYPRKSFSAAVELYHSQNKKVAPFYILTYRVQKSIFEK